VSASPGTHRKILDVIGLSRLRLSLSPIPSWQLADGHGQDTSSSLVIGSLGQTSTRTANSSFSIQP